MHCRWIPVLFLLGTEAFSANETDIKIPEKKDGCYQISSIQELFGFASVVNETQKNAGEAATCANLLSDIAWEEGYVWVPLETFSGIFDGRGHTISGLVSQKGGLFAYVNGESKENPAIIKNIGIVNSELGDFVYAGSIANETRGVVLIENVYNNSPVYGSFSTGYVGGLVGHQEGDLTISNSYNSGTVNGAYELGGLVGSSWGRLTIKNSYNSGNIAGFSSAYGTSFVGGLVGRSHKEAYVYNSYNIGKIESGTFSGRAGGIMGEAVDGALINSYNAGEIIKTGSIYSGLIALRNSSNFVYENVFSTAAGGFFGTIVSTELLMNGKVALALHSYHGRNVDGSIWGQKIGVDSIPVLGKNMTGNFDNFVVSAINLNTFEGDTVKYVDKYVEGVGTILPTPYQEGLKFDGWYATETFEGNSAQRIDASATGDKSFYAKWIDTTLISSSSTDIESSSSSEQTTRLAKRMTKSFNLSTQGRRLAVTGAGTGIVRIFDSLGHLVAEQELSGGNANFVLNNNGRYVVKLNGNQKGFNIH